MSAEHDLRDRCCWRGCTHESGLIFMGAGLCDDHWTQACSVYLPTMDYLLTRIIPEAAEEIRRTHKANQEKGSTA